MNQIDEEPKYAVRQLQIFATLHQFTVTSSVPNSTLLSMIHLNCTTMESCSHIHIDMNFKHHIDMIFTSMPHFLKNESAFRIESTFSRYAQAFHCLHHINKFDF